MKLFRTQAGPVVIDEQGRVASLDRAWDELVRDESLHSYLRQQLAGAKNAGSAPVAPLAPIQSQEVWAAGVTYLRSKIARMEESESAGGGDFYDRVYDAPRPEIFFKATPHRVVGPDQPVMIRSDSRWNVPEPELALLISPGGKILGYTIGNDMSSRDIEGENPLYLPQAKVYDGCCALGPCVWISETPPPPSTAIQIKIRRQGQEVFAGQTTLAQMKRKLPELVTYLFRDNSFPNGCYLLTGTGVVPPDDFTLERGDEVAITIEPMGTLRNGVGVHAIA